MPISCPSCKSFLKNANFNCNTCNWKPRLMDGILCFAPKLAYENSGFDEDVYNSYLYLQTKIISCYGTATGWL